MNQDYTDIIQQVSQVLLQAIKERELNLAQNVDKLDGSLAKLLRLIGLQVISMSVDRKLWRSRSGTLFVLICHS